MRVTEMYWAGEWVEVDISSIKKGDIFRMFEPDGTPVRDKGTTFFLATDDAFYCNEWETFVVTYEVIQEM